MLGRFRFVDRKGNTDQVHPRIKSIPGSSPGMALNVLTGRAFGKARSVRCSRAPNTRDAYDDGAPSAQLVEAVEYRGLRRCYEARVSAARVFSVVDLVIAFTGGRSRLSISLRSSTLELPSTVNRLMID